MSDREIEETRAFWNDVAEDWRTQVGDEGDSNRRLSSDPVLWAFAGDVHGLEVLDAGCGTRYLSNKLSERGALVTGIDLSERMIAIARESNPSLDFRVDSCSSLRTIDDECFDMVIANYVLMDTPDAQGATEAFSRVLKPAAWRCWSSPIPVFPRRMRFYRKRVEKHSSTSGTLRTSKRRNARTPRGRILRPIFHGFIARCRTIGRRSPRQDSQ